MKILILNGASDNFFGANEKIKEISNELISNGHSVSRIDLSDKNIKDCVGCFNCWVKHPGICGHKDDMEDILREVIKNDYHLMVTDVNYTMIGPELTSVVNRFIPLACAYLKVDDNNKMSHYGRYEGFKFRSSLLVNDYEGRNDENIKDLAYCMGEGETEDYLGTYILGQNHKELINVINNN